MDIKEFENIYMVGIGGIGMSALARYFRQKSLKVSGYDRSASDVTRALQSEGISVTFEAIEENVDKTAELVVYTPAVRKDNPILVWYQKNGYPVYKRAEVLQWITEGMTCITVAGTHGKTTISTMIAYLLRAGGLGGSAFLGGISINYKTNFWQSTHGDIAVIEADEYDRSFLKLTPSIAVLTAMDADHMDIYGNMDALRAAFVAYTRKIKPGGILWYKHGLKGRNSFGGEHKFTYSLQNDMADAYAENIQINNGSYFFDWKNNKGDCIEKLELNLGGMHNVENAVVAIAIALSLGMEEEEIRKAVSDFKGVKRRFEYILKTEELVYIDDYAHHPNELTTLIRSAKALFPNKKCTVVFQPHLYSRTRDLVAGFVGSFFYADEVILLPIYPAREEPIPGISSECLKEKLENPVCTVLSQEGLLEFVERAPLELLITAGAGDIDKLVMPVKERLLKKIATNSKEG